MNKKIACIVPYPQGLAPSQRFRFEQYIPFLSTHNFQIDFHPFFTETDYTLLYQSKQHLFKIYRTLIGFFKRFLLLFRINKYSIVFIHREASPIGPPIFEWIIVKVLKKKIIYDFDDAIWLKNTSESNKLVSNVKVHSKVKRICKWADMVFCGNKFLLEYAEQFNSNVKYIPTTIDTDNTHNIKKKHQSSTINIGWTGTHSTIKYLNNIESTLSELQNEIDFNFIIISDIKPEFKKLNYTFIKWNKNSEINDLLKLDIGIMPLEESEWSKGKCGFKALQYMSLSIPTVVSPIGVNTTIINNGINGFCASLPSDWKQHLKQLIQNIDLRKELGNNGYITIEERYSVNAYKNKYLNLIEELIAQ